MQLGGQAATRASEPVVVRLGVDATGRFDLQRDEVARLAAISVDYYTLDHTARLVIETGSTWTRYAATDHTQ